MAFPIGVLFDEPYYKPQGFFGQLLPNATLVFLRSGSAGPIQSPATVYQDGARTVPYSQPITADANGRFNPIYLTPGIAYRVQLFDQTGRRMEDDDPYVAQPPFFYQSIVKQADTARASTLNVQFDPDLQMQLPYPGVYRFDFQLGYSISAVGNNGNLVMSVDVSTGEMSATAPQEVVGIGNLTGTVNQTNIFALVVKNTNSPSGTGGTTFTFQNQDPTVNFMWMRGFITMQTPGLLGLAWAQSTSNLAPTTLRKGSSLTVRQLQ